MFVGSAFILGLVGNFHCLGMCGPIALAVPLKSANSTQRLVSVVLYNLGRILVYSILGGIFGLLGEGIYIAGYQQQLSIVLGVLIILGILFPFVLKKSSLLNTSIFYSLGKMKAAFHKQFQRKTYASIFTIGILNGMLPCGLVYIAVAGAVATGSFINGMLFMTLFGLGTAPVMMALPYFKHLISNTLRLKFQKWVPVFIVFFGILLIFRGANLGIPFLSPEINTEMKQSEVKCH